jgi:hypothetical protein
VISTWLEATSVLTDLGIKTEKNRVRLLQKNPTILAKHLKDKQPENQSTITQKSSALQYM